jgi:hypothetical protein
MNRSGAGSDQAWGRNNLQGHPKSRCLPCTSCPAMEVWPCNRPLVMPD